MNAQESSERALVEKWNQLSPDRRAEVEDFIDFLHGRGRESRITADFMRRSEDALGRVWDNGEDADYDRL